LWFFKLSNRLQPISFIASKSYYSLFYKFWNNNSLYVLIYVDDIITTGSSLTIVKDFIHKLGQSFALKDLDKLHYFFDVKVTSLSIGEIHLL